MAFEQFSVDSRILKALKRLDWSVPTNVQKEALPKALGGKDLLIKSKTGSGKTAVYAIATLECLLRRVAVTTDTSSPSNSSCIHSIVVAPSRELCTQVYNCLYELSQFSRRFVSLVNLVDDTLFDEHLKNATKTRTTYDIVIGTPSRMVSYLSEIPTTKLLSSLKQVIFDEADLLFGYGYEDEIKQLIGTLCGGKNHNSQIIVVSATLNSSVAELCDQILDEPISVEPDESPLPSTRQLSQYVVKCEKGDKFLILYALIKLSLLKGRFIIFANEIQTAFKLKLFLDKFKIYSCVLNNELPFNSRYHLVEYFNSGKLDILIATDQSTTVKVAGTGPKKPTADNEYSSSRGIDFVKVDNIINFDFPSTVTSYIHRVGRTARANQPGIALSLVSPHEKPLLQGVEQYLSRDTNQTLKPFSFKVDIVEGFRYRVNDALFSLNKSKINAARRAEIKRELLNSKQLNEHFKKNPSDRIAIKHDFNVPAKSSLHSMGFVPDYLIPEPLKANASTIPSARFVAGVGKSHIFKKIRRKNPLKSFKR